jgi:hypothetical protein
VLSAPSLTSLGPALLALAILVAVFAIGWVVARRRGPVAVERGYWVLALCGAVALATLVITPIDVIGLTPHKIRYLWIIGAFGTYLLLLTLVGALGSRGRRIALAGVTAVGLLAAIATVPFHAAAGGPVELRDSYESVDDLRSQLADYFAHDATAPDAVRFDASGIGFAEPYTSPVMAQLVESGVDLVVDDVALSRQLGPRRLADRDDDARPLVYVRTGSEALEEHPGVDRIAFHQDDHRAVAVLLSRDGTVPR